MIYQISSDRSSLDIQGSKQITAQVINEIDDNGTYHPQILKCWTGSDNWQLALAHELGHILVRIIKPQIHAQYFLDYDMAHLLRVPSIAIIRNEILAWRICKSILNPKFWDNAWRWRLNASWQARYQTTLPEEFRIIEYQKGGKQWKTHSEQ